MTTIRNTRRGKSRLASHAALVLASTGVTQAQVAERFGITARAVGFWLDGQVTPNPDLPRALADLMSGDDVQRVMGALPRRPAPVAA